MYKDTGYSIVQLSVDYLAILKYLPTLWILSFENLTHIKMLIKEKIRRNQEDGSTG